MRSRAAGRRDRIGQPLPEWVLRDVEIGCCGRRLRRPRRTLRVIDKKDAPEAPLPRGPMTRRPLASVPGNGAGSDKSKDKNHDSDGGAGKTRHEQPPIRKRNALSLRRPDRSASARHASAYYLGHQPTGGLPTASDGRRSDAQAPRRRLALRTLADFDDRAVEPDRGRVLGQPSLLLELVDLRVALDHDRGRARLPS